MNVRQERGKRPALSTREADGARGRERRILADGAEVHADSQARSLRERQAAAFSKAGATARTDVLETMPSRCARRMPRDTPSVRP